MNSSDEAFIHPDRRYFLYRRFWMPTTHGSVLAVAVPDDTAKKLQSLYALMLQTIMTEIWIIILVVLMGLSMRRQRNFSKNIGVANVAIWNQRFSPISVATSMLEAQKHIRPYALMWIILALLALSGQKLLSIFISPRLILGNAAPVNPKAVFIPTFPNSTNNSATLMYHILTNPAMQRAVNALDGVDPFTGNLVNFNSTTHDAVRFVPHDIQPADGSNTSAGFDYSYRVSGVDFGLQKLSDLVYTVEGSCHTDYSWYQGISTDDEHKDEDKYEVPGYGPRYVSSAAAQANPPIVSVFTLTTKPTNTTFNYTYAFIVSSVNRTSYTQSQDPWYLTKLVNASASQYTVMNGRPVLVCWELDTWTYQGANMSTMEFTSGYLFPSAIQQIILTFLNLPKITDLGSNLGVLALQSAVVGSLSTYFDAGSSSLLKDMQRLVYGSYIATKNTFMETTVSNHASYPENNTANVNNLLQASGSKMLMDGTGDFVVFGSGIAALSVSFLCTVPIVLLFLLAVVSLISSGSLFGWLWGHLNALNATILYSTIDSEHFRDMNEDTWKRTSATPYCSGNEKSNVRPRYDRTSHSYGWSISSNGADFPDALQTEDSNPKPEVQCQSSNLMGVKIPSSNTRLLGDHGEYAPVGREAQI